MNVYVIAADPTPLFQGKPGVEELVQMYRTNGKWWETIRGALPYDHNLTGSYYYASMCPMDYVHWPEPYISRSEDYSGFPLLFASRAEGVRSPERQRLQAIRRSDIGFLWLTEEVTAEMVSDAMYLYGTGLDIVVACESEDVLLDHPMMLEVLREKVVECKHQGIHAAYSVAMADMEVRIKQRFVLLTAKYTGLCRGCGSSYSPQEPIMWSRAHGVYHKDCYDSLQDPAKKSSAIFSSELISSLRTKVQELEYENTMLMARVSTLERGGK